MKIPCCLFYILGLETRIEMIVFGGSCV